MSERFADRTNRKPNHRQPFDLPFPQLVELTPLDRDLTPLGDDRERAFYCPDGDPVSVDLDHLEITTWL